MTLVVMKPFADYARGDQISDPAKVAAILSGENIAHVVRINTAGDVPAPAGE